MARFWEFRLATQVQFGRGGLRRIGEVVRQWGGSALLVGYREAPALEEAYAKAIKALQRAEIAVTPFREVQGEPDAELVAEGARRAEEAGSRVVVALGGGSAIDAAKGIAAIGQTRRPLWDHADANPESRPATKSLHVIAVPTTAGTGSEVSGVAVFSFPSASGSGTIKSSIYGSAVAPRVALVDPDLAMGSSAALTAASGADALGHAIEATLSRKANPFSSLLAGRAIALIEKNLPHAVKEPHAPEPRESLALAAFWAGAAFNEAGVTVSHAMAHALGAVLDIPHAVAVAIATPRNLRFNAEACPSQYAELADAIGIGGESAAERAERFVQRIESLLSSVGLPDRVEMPADAPSDLLDRLVDNAMESTAVGITLNPRKVDRLALRGLFAECLRKPG